MSAEALSALTHTIGAHIGREMNECAVTFRVDEEEIPAEQWNAYRAKLFESLENGGLVMRVRIEISS